MLLARRPCPALAPFVKRLWFSEQEPRPGAPLERVLPTGTMHLVLRLHGGPFRFFEAADGGALSSLGMSVVGGARAEHYVKDVSQTTRSVGVQFHAGSAPCLLGVSAAELSHRHVSLEDLWGAQARELQALLAELREPCAVLGQLERALCERLPRVRGLHPAVAEALARAGHQSEVRTLVEHSGYSHRRFISLFHEAVGLTPKLFLRVQRLQRVLARCEAQPALGWAELALGAGYTDQAHFNREFRAFTGLTPGRYRALGPSSANHVPIHVGDAAGQIHTRPARRRAPE